MKGTAMTTTTHQSHPSPLAETLEAFFRTKTSCDVAGTMSWFSRDLATYTDATLGWDVASFDAVQAIFEQYMPHWGPPARSYATGIHSNEHSALIHMVDTPELFGGELRILAAVDFADGKIVRWVDYWDATPFDAALYTKMRTPADAFPSDLKDDVVATRAAPEMVAAATALQSAFAAGDAKTAAALLHTDVVFEDMTLRTRLLGGIETAGYLSRALDSAPYGRASVLRHVVGGGQGGGFEWTAADGLVGITAIELGADGLISRVTSVYDGRQLPVDRRTTLLAATFA
jgi:ketosteroid isomerase-like protein